MLDANITALSQTKFIYDYVGPHRKKDFPRKMRAVLLRYFPAIPEKEIEAAAEAAYAEYDAYMGRVRSKGKEFLALAKEKDLPVIVLSGRPYHLDPEINHGIDKLICDCGAVVVTEDSVSDLVEKFPTGVLNQWTYHSRLYCAAKFVAESGDKRINLVQLVSFGCGVDAITGDEVRAILEEGGRSAHSAEKPVCRAGLRKGKGGLIDGGRETAGHIYPGNEKGIYHHYPEHGPHSF